MATESPSSDTLRCIVVTPEATVLDTDATFVALPLFDGELGVGRNHSPMIGRLGYGELRLVSGGTTRRYYIDGGFVQVADNVVSVLTNRSVPAESIDVEAASVQLAEALARRPAGEEELKIRDRLVRQARAQLRIAKR
jgi:F-type H+-transporting ATPase subunit epsilon